MMRKTGILYILLVALVSTFGCGTAATNTSTSNTAQDSTQTASKPGSDTRTERDLSPALAYESANNSTRIERAVLKEHISVDQTQTSQIDTAPSDRKIIRNADLSLEAVSPEETQHRITAVAENNGGFVIESQSSSSDVRTTKRDTVSMSIRVPSQKFTDTIAQIRETAATVISETVKGDDVTEEFIDVEARLKAKKALEQQFVEIMKRTNGVDDALNVQRQLAEVRGEIEKIEGRKRFLENQASLSTIRLKVQTPAVYSASSTAFTYRLGQSFATGVDFALNFVLGLLTVVIAVLPFALLVGLPSFFLMRYVWKRQSRAKSLIEIADEELKAT